MALGSRLTIPLGPFDLLEPLARGGMGEVWRGVHRKQRLPVAVKVLSESCASERSRLAFSREVRSMAGLVHPRIVVVLDQGPITAEAARRSGGRLVAGIPSFAMELGKSTLNRWWERQEPTWAAARDVLLQVLDALAHGHARGVVHRDLKPGNILQFGDDPGQPIWKLSDYGIALSMDDLGDGAEQAGTPSYMAPEQIGNRVADLGPWTDLYALGCLGWWLTTGQNLFSGEVDYVLTSQLCAPPPQYRPMLPVPEELKAWLHVCLRKNPSRRFQRAADAAWALLQLGGSVGELTGGARVVVDNDTTATLFTIDSEQTTPLAERALAAAGPTMRSARSTLERPPLPENWGRPAWERPPLKLLGAGLGLFGVRRIPIVDRVPQRDVLWRLLGEVNQSGTARLVALAGAAGVGKSRLADWICERAHEVGAASVVKVTHNAAGGPMDGLEPMIRGFLHCNGLERVAVEERVHAWLGLHGPVDREELSGLTELIRPLVPGGNPSLAPHIPLRTDADRYRVVDMFLARLSEERTTIVWLDDVQWGRDTLRYVCAASRSSRLLWVLTLREDVLREDSGAKAEFEQLLARPGATQLRVEPLADRHRITLIEELLGLRGELAARVDERTQGNPLFAVHLVGDWVDRGVLVVGESGFELRAGAVAPIPDAIHDLWNMRVDALVSTTPSDRLALELAATLGQSVDMAEWTAVCAALEVAPGNDLLDRLGDAGLVTSTPGQLDFVHGMLAESLRRLAEEAGRSHVQRRECARILGDRGRGRRDTDHRAAASLVGRAVELADDPATRATLQMTLGGILLRLGKPAEALGHLEVSLKTARSVSARRAEANTLIWLGLLHHEQGRMDAAEAAFELSLDIHRREGNRDLEGMVLGNLGLLYADQSRTDEALRAYEAALRIQRAEGDRRSEAMVLSHLGHVYGSAGRLDEADAAYAKAMKITRAVQNRRFEGMLLGFMGNTLADRGQAVAAEEAFEAALAIHREVGDRRAEGVALGNLGVRAAEAGRTDQARERLAAALVVHREVGNRRSEGTVLHGIGRLCLSLGALEKAAEVLSRAATIAEEVRDFVGQGVALGALAELDARAGRAAEANEKLLRACKLVEASTMERCRMQCQRGQVAVLLGDSAQARRALSEARQVFAGTALGTDSELAKQVGELEAAIGAS